MAANGKVRRSGDRKFGFTAVSGSQIRTYSDFGIANANLQRFGDHSCESAAGFGIVTKSAAGLGSQAQIFSDFAVATVNLQQFCCCDWKSAAVLGSQIGICSSFGITNASLCQLYNCSYKSAVVLGSQT